MVEELKGKTFTKGVENSQQEVGREEISYNPLKDYDY